ncbi:MAG: LysM peptidoglycan-binding domain-containing protein [Candidatus Acidiferrum sp.]
MRFTAHAILFLSIATFGAIVGRAQDQQDPQNQQDQSVAEAARQERARKQELQKHSAHVYTDNDLEHAHILTPADRAVVEAKRNECAQKNNCSSAPSQNPSGSLDANSQPDRTSLGEVARKYRQQKELQALKPKQSEPFHLSIGTPALAAPILPERPEIRLPVQPELRPKMSSHVFRRDPFSAVSVRPEVRRTEIRRSEVRVPEIRPSAHEVVRSEVRSKAHDENIPVARANAHPNFSSAVRPVLRASRRMTAPAQPKIFSRRPLPGLLIQPMQPPIPSSLAQPVAPLSRASAIRPAGPQPAFVSGATVSQRTLTVQPGDTLWRLAQQNLGHGSHWPEFLAPNRWIANPNLIRPGAQLYLPEASSTPVTVGDASDTRIGEGNSVILVHRGDTLWSLAKSNLGHSSDWPCLATANPSLTNPNLIYEGQHLLLPAFCFRNAPLPSLPVLQKPHSLRNEVPQVLKPI